MSDGRECTCHPDDNPPRPCPQKFAYSECVRASHQERAIQGMVDRLKRDAWPIMWGRCPKCGSWTITDGEEEWCSFIGGEDIPACAWQDALPLNSQAICRVLKASLPPQETR